MSTSIVVSGYVSMDRIVFVDTPVQTGQTSVISNQDYLKIYYGGCSINIASLLNLLYMETIPLIRVGSDYEANGFKKYLEDTRIPQVGVQVVTSTTTSSSLMVQDKNNNHIALFFPGAMDNQYFKEYDECIFKNAQYAIMTVAPLKDNQFLLRKCKENTIPLVFSMKSDFSAFPISFLKEVLDYSSILFMNELECRKIEEILHIENILDLFETSSNAQVVITTLGKKGSRYYYRGKDGKFSSDTVPAFLVDSIVDATGTGDAYIAGFLYGYLRNEDIKMSCQLGSLLASIIIGRFGCSFCIEDRDMIIACIKKNYNIEIKKEST